MSYRKRDVAVASGDDFEARLASARAAKASAMSAQDHERGGADDPESATYWARKQRHLQSVQERATKQRRDENERAKTDRATLGFGAWKDKELELLRQKDLERADDDARDVRSDRQRREESRAARQLERTEIREREASEADRRGQERAQDDAWRKARAQEERDDWQHHWTRREQSRDELQLRRQRLQDERHAREDERVLQKSLRESRQQLAEEAETVAASDWSHILTLRGKERDRRLLRLARLQASLPLPDDADSSVMPGDALEDEAHLRDAKRLRRREAALHKRVAEGEADGAATASWYLQRQYDRADRTRRAIKSIDPPPPPVLGDQ